MLELRIGERDSNRVRLTITMCYGICKSLLYQIVLNCLLYPKILGNE